MVHKKILAVAVITLFLTAFSGFAWTPPQENPKSVIGGFFTIYGDKYPEPSFYPTDVKKTINVWIISFVHAYDSNGSPAADIGEAAWYGTDPDSYPDTGSIVPPTDKHVKLGYEQQRWNKTRVKIDDTDYCRIKGLVEEAHANGAIALLCLGYNGDIARINEEEDTYSKEEWTFPQSVLDLVKLVGADGFDIDCEGTTLRESTTKAIRKVFDEAGVKEGRKYFLTMDTAHGYDKNALKHCDMVFDQTYYRDHYKDFVPDYIQGNQFVVGASYETGNSKPKGALADYRDYKNENGCLGCFLWNVASDADHNWEGIRKYFTKENINANEHSF